MSVPECSPRVSVVIAVYGERFLRQALESVLAHTFADLEIIVVDDGSVDETAILKEFSERDARLKVMRQSNAGYVTASRHVSGDAGRSPEGSPDRKSAWASSDPDATRGIRSGRRISSSVRACRGLGPLAQDQRLARTLQAASVAAAHREPCVDGPAADAIGVAEILMELGHRWGAIGTRAGYRRLAREGWGEALPACRETSDPAAAGFARCKSMRSSSRNKATDFIRHSPAAPTVPACVVSRADSR
jgi:cellulose synthase/poly-beta-1,6-N-acetylglucosamine synthase-like glycosyltransferase